MVFCMGGRCLVNEIVKMVALKQRDRTKGILCCTEENVDRCVLECAKLISCASNQRYMISLFLIVRMVNIDSLLCIRTSNVA